jgi:putative isomerase
MSEYRRLNARLARGWNTWNVRSVLSHVRLPDGFVLNLGLKEFEFTSYLKEALIARPEQREEQVRPGLRSYDGGYTELELAYKGIELRVQSAVAGEDLLLLVTPLKMQRKTALLTVEGGLLWNRPGHVCLEDGVLTAHTPAGTTPVFPTADLLEDPHIPAQGPYLVIALEGPVGIATGSARCLSEITEHMAARRKEEVARVAAFGDLAEVYVAIQTAMAWDTIYDPSKDRVITPVCHLVSVLSGGYILFCWDLYFAGYMAALDNPDLAYANTLAMTEEATEAGMVPNYAQPDGFKSYDRSEPCVGAAVARELYRRFGDRWFLEEIYDGLFAWNRWWHENRMNGDLLSWGSTPYTPLADRYWEHTGVNDTFGGALESGLDNSPLYDEVAFDQENHWMKLHDVGLNSLYIADCNALAEIADVLGKQEDALRLRECADGLSESMQALWDEDTGLFLNRHTDTGILSKRLAPTLFYPLLAKIATQAQADRMINEHFFNPEEFWSDWVLPSIARNDPAYSDQEYWRGRIWAPMNFLVYLGLRNYDLPEAQTALVEKSKALLLKEWREHGYVCENYCADTGAGGEEGGRSDRFYHWGGLLGLMAFIEAERLPAPEASLT